MGFFSNLLSAATSIFLPQAPAAAPAAAPPPLRMAAPAPLGKIPSARVGGGLAGRAMPRTVGEAREAGQVSITTGVGARGGMKNRLQTIIQTIAPDGTILESEVREGRPFLMRSDFVTAKRVRKLISKARNKIIPTRREESEQTKLMKAVVQTATRRVLTGPEPCPPKC